MRGAAAREPDAAPRGGAHLRGRLQDREAAQGGRSGLALRGRAGLDQQAAGAQADAPGAGRQAHVAPALRARGQDRGPHPERPRGGEHRLGRRHRLGHALAGDGAARGSGSRRLQRSRRSTSPRPRCSRSSPSSATPSGRCAPARRIIHRDLKPENTLPPAPRGGAPACPSWSRCSTSASPASLAESPTVSGSTPTGLGTPMWMAPEQTVPGGPVGPGTDVWPLGLLAFRLLTGYLFWKAPYEGGASVMMLMAEAFFMHPLPTASARAEHYKCKDRLPPGFDAWFARCVARPMEHRYADAAETPSAPSSPCSSTFGEEAAPPSRTLALVVGRPQTPDRVGRSGRPSPADAEPDGLSSLPLPEPRSSERPGERRRRHQAHRPRESHLGGRARARPGGPAVGARVRLGHAASSLAAGSGGRSGDDRRRATASHRTRNVMISAGLAGRAHRRRHLRAFQRGRARGPAARMPRSPPAAPIAAAASPRRAPPPPARWRRRRSPRAEPRNRRVRPAWRRALLRGVGSRRDAGDGGPPCSAAVQAGGRQVPHQRRLLRPHLPQVGLAGANAALRDPYGDDEK